MLLDLRGRWCFTGFEREMVCYWNGEGDGVLLYLRGDGVLLDLRGRWCVTGFER